MIDQLPPHQREVIAAAQAAQPVRLGDIARAFGISVKASTLPAGISGEIRPSGGAFEIKVNRHDSRGRQRFTVAHELAHFLLHRDQIGSGVSDDALYRSSLSDAREAEANRLAADILMPRESVRAAFAESVGSFEERLQFLADHFGVSEAAMAIRLEQVS
ncbi:ImmA/IrrE family metallo-endopeptidase [Brevundimonas staleyi]|uniref:ImmA/IrrE family metallo-endopeptidase n=1 Tax=Brevundimonas staleyi TaxID=74326 RepID=A0ABW0FVT9_9CAUL